MSNKLKHVSTLPPDGTKKEVVKRKLWSSNVTSMFHSKSRLKGLKHG